MGSGVWVVKTDSGELGGSQGFVGEGDLQNVGGLGGGSQELWGGVTAG